MTIEEELFRKAKVDFDKIIEYGFRKDKSLYKYSKNIMDNTFRVDIEISLEGIVKGKVYDLSFVDEYTNFRIEDNIGSFVGQVREEFKNILKDIKNNCFTEKIFLYNQSNRIAENIKEKYGDSPEFKWDKYPTDGIFRNKDSKKWYGLIMKIDKSKLNKNDTGEIEVINMKLDPSEILDLLNEDGFFPAYHMNKKSWITIILNDTISDERIMSLIDESYSYTVTNKHCTKNEWIIPANPNYFDIDKALKENTTMTWKQSADIKINDIVYIYVGKPYSSIMYKFKVLDVNIPYEYKDENLKMQKIMKIELIKRYKKGKLSLDKLKEFGVNSIRSQRYMPVELSEYINKNL